METLSGPDGPSGLDKNEWCGEEMQNVRDHREVNHWRALFGHGRQAVPKYYFITVGTNRKKGGPMGQQTEH